MQKWQYARTLFKSIRFRLVAGVLAIILPFCIYFIYNGIYSINAMRNQAANSNKKLISLYMRVLENQLDSVGAYMADNLANDSDYSDLQYRIDENQRKLTEAKILNRLTSDQPQYGFVDSLFIFIANSLDYIAVYNPSIDYTLKNRMEKYLRDLLVDRHNNDMSVQRKFTAEIDGTNYFFHILRNGNLYMGMWVSFDHLEMPLDLINIGEAGTSLFVDADNRAMNHKDFVEKNNIVLKNDYSDYYMTHGKEDSFLVVGKKSNDGLFGLVALIPDKQILGNLSYMNYIVTIMSVFTLLMILLFILFLRIIVIQPFNRITGVMKQIQNGDMDARIAPMSSSGEMSVITNTFNNMMDQIKELKINVYEEQISKQKEELEHLQLQIRPHFILNSLNIIHGLAQIRDYKLIQEMSLCLSEYFSYISRKKMLLVRLEEELQHVRNYMRIQQLRFLDNLKYEITVPEQYFDVLVPPLVIQTFVENTVKYAMNMDEQTLLSIAVTPEKLENCEGIRITMHNSGDCISEDILEQIRAGKRIIDKYGEHIGIWNVQRRLELIYSGRAKLTFDNMQPKGVIMEITIPVQP